MVKSIVTTKRSLVRAFLFLVVAGLIATLTACSSGDSDGGSGGSAPGGGGGGGGVEGAQPIGGTGILWKPISEGNRRLVVLTPASWAKANVAVLNKKGEVLENGNYVGRTNGNRCTYRFTTKGGDFPAPCYLEVGDKLFEVPNPGKRYD